MQGGTVRSDFGELDFTSSFRFDPSTLVSWVPGLVAGPFGGPRALRGLLLSLPPPHNSSLAGDLRELSCAPAPTPQGFPRGGPPGRSRKSESQCPGVTLFHFQ